MILAGELVFFLFFIEIKTVWVLSDKNEADVVDDVDCQLAP